MSELNSIESSAGLRRDQVEKVMREYRSLFDNSGGDDLATRRKHYEIVVNHFYDLVTDFYEFGWGDSFISLLASAANAFGRRFGVASEPLQTGWD